MNDLSSELKEQWAGQSLEIEALTRSLRLRQLYERALLVLAVTGALLAFAAGIYFAVKAIRQRDFLYAFSALALLAAVPPAAVAEFRVRREALRWHDQTPEGIIRHALARTFITERLLRITLINACILVALVLVVWGAVLLGEIPTERRLAAVTGTWLGFSLMNFLWVRWRRRVNQLEKHRCETLLAEYSRAETNSEAQAE